MRICPKCQQTTDKKTCPDDGYQTVVQRRAVATPADPLLGKVFEERYTIDALLGRGGFGAVYHGTQLAIGRSVAIKVLKASLADDLKEVARFQQEARAIAAIKHPNIIEIYDFGQTAEGNLYLVMDHLIGEPLADLLEREGALPPERVIHLATQVLGALAEAHDKGIIHRDIKPDNLFIAKEGRRTDVVKVLDFGIAKVTGDAGADMTLTQAGFAIGSPKYMSPEQCRAKNITPQSDVYSFGCILYQMLFGRMVFNEDGPSGYYVAQMTLQPAVPIIDGMVPAGPLVDTIMACLQKRPSERPQGAETVARLLTEAGKDGLHWETASAEMVAAAMAATESDPTAAGDARADGTAVLGSLSPHHDAGSETKMLVAPGDKSPKATDATIMLATGLSAASGAAEKPKKSRRGLILAAAAVVLLGGGAAAMLASGGDGSDGTIPESTAASKSEAKPLEGKVRPGVDEDREGIETEEVRVLAKPDPSGRVVKVAAVSPTDTLPAVATPKVIEPAANAPEVVTPKIEAAPAHVPPPPTNHSVSVTSTPEGAFVYIDEQRVGKTPFDVVWNEGETPPIIKLHGTNYSWSTVRLRQSDVGRTRHVKMVAVVAPKPRPTRKAGPAPRKKPAAATTPARTAPKAATPKPAAATKPKAVERW